MLLADRAHEVRRAGGRALGGSAMCAGLGGGDDRCARARGWTGGNGCRAAAGHVAMRCARAMAIQAKPCRPKPCRPKPTPCRRTLNYYYYYY